MSNVAVGERYAQAFFDVVGKTSESESFSQLLEKAAAAYQMSSELRSVLSNPVLPIERREALLSSIISALGGSDLSRRSLLVMLRRGRISALSEAAHALRALVDTASGVIRGEVVTAVPMPDAFYVGLEQSLATSAAGGAGKRVVLERKLDPSLVGGAIARVDGRTIDQSVRGQLERIERELLASVGSLAAEASA